MLVNEIIKDSFGPTETACALYNSIQAWEVFVRDGYNGIPHEYSFPHEYMTFVKYAQIIDTLAAQICSLKSAFDVGGCAFWRRFAYRFGMRDGGFGLQMGFDAGAGLEVDSTSFI